MCFFHLQFERSGSRNARRASKTPEKSRKSIYDPLRKEDLRYIVSQPFGASLYLVPNRSRSIVYSVRRFSESDDDTANTTPFYSTPRGSVGGSSLGTISPRASMQQDSVPCNSKVGVVITSSRQSHRR